MTIRPPNFPEGVVHIPNHFEVAVHTCWDAAINRNIYLEEELKSLLLEIEGNIYLFHGTGNRTVSFSKLRLRYGEKLRILPLDKLHSLGLGKGLVNPFNTGHINLHKVLICSSVLALIEVYTNDGTANGTIKFDPELLLYTHDDIVVEYYSNEFETIFDAPPSHKKDRERYKYSFGDFELDLISNNHVFKPTKYASLFVDAIVSRDLSHRYVCDMGTGSGIFGIIASLKGATVTAVDINPYSVVTSHLNAIINGSMLDVIHSNCFSSIPKDRYGFFDYIICNPPTIPDSNGTRKRIWNNNGNGRLVLDEMLTNSRHYLRRNGRLIVASSSQQDWDRTKKLIDLHWSVWWIISSEIMVLSELYLPYADEWHRDGLIEYSNGCYWHEVKVIELVNV